MADIKIKRITEPMLCEIADIERICFCSAAWSKKSLEILLSFQAVGFAAFIGDRLIGYVGMMTVLDEGQITNVAVLPEFRRMGVARALLEELERFAVSVGIVFLSLEVRRSNEAARSLYSSNGWIVAGERRGFYSAPIEDAVVMTKTLEK